jgi:hypothetical protein
MWDVYQNEEHHGVALEVLTQNFLRGEGGICKYPRDMGFG